MNVPMLKSVCEEEMWNTHLDSNEAIIEYLTDAHGNKMKRLKPMLIKSEPDREYTQHILSDDDVSAVPEEDFTQKREVDTTFSLFMGSMYGPLTLSLSFPVFYFDFQVYSFLSVIV